MQKVTYHFFYKTPWNTENTEIIHNLTKDLSLMKVSKFPESFTAHLNVAAMPDVVLCDSHRQARAVRPLEAQSMLVSLCILSWRQNSGRKGGKRIISLFQWCGWQMWENMAWISPQHSSCFVEEYSVLLCLNIKDVYWEKQGEDNAFLDRLLL